MMDEAEEKVFNIITEFTGEIGEYDVKLIARRIVESIGFEKVEDNVVGEKYAIKMDFKKWLGREKRLTDGKVYCVYKNEFGNWWFNDDRNIERACWLFKDWKKPYKLNTDIAFELKGDK